MINEFLDIIFPQKCYYCGKIGYVICKKCLEKIKTKPLLQKVNNEDYDYVFFGTNYNGAIRTEIHSFKFHRKAYLYEYFITLSLKDEKICEFLKKFDYITYVPMYYRKEEERGYNQSKLLAKELGRKLKLKTITLLEKKKENKMQSTLSKEERAINVQDVFLFKTQKNIADQNIILVDDIFTTGATVRECSKLLKEHGAGEICVFTIAKA